MTKAKQKPAKAGATPKTGKPPGDKVAKKVRKPANEIERPTHAELELRIRFVSSLIERGYTHGEIKRETAKAFGCAPRTAEGYLRRARDLICEHIGQSIEDLRGESVLRLLGIFRTSENPRDKLGAQQQLTEILGLKMVVTERVHIVGEGLIDMRAQQQAAHSDPEFAEWCRQKAMGDDAEQCRRECEDDATGPESGTPDGAGEGEDSGGIVPGSTGET